MEQLLEHSADTVVNRPVPAAPLEPDFLESTKKTRLSLKTLHGMFQELLEENRKIAERLDLLEQQLADPAESRRETAATLELSDDRDQSEWTAVQQQLPTRPEWTSIAIASGSPSSAVRAYLPSRADRHPPHKKTLRDWFRFGK